MEAIGWINLHTNKICKVIFIQEIQVQAYSLHALLIPLMIFSSNWLAS